MFVVRGIESAVGTSGRVRGVLGVVVRDGVALGVAGGGTERFGIGCFVIGGMASGEASARL